ncbi:MAG: hypothetical protein JSR76_08690 [Verrucomicrobia bacterium]|nr:hypothetical protein [Verrucomicrobiota bacterium]
METVGCLPNYLPYFAPICHSEKGCIKDGEEPDLTDDLLSGRESEERQIFSRGCTPRVDVVGRSYSINTQSFRSISDEEEGATRFPSPFLEKDLYSPFDVESEEEEECLVLRVRPPLNPNAHSSKKCEIGDLAIIERTSGIFILQGEIKAPEIIIVADYIVLDNAKLNAASVTFIADAITVKKTAYIYCALFRMKITEGYPPVGADPHDLPLWEVRENRRECRLEARVIELK